MPRIRVSRTVDAPATRVWEELADIESHVEWMADAASIELTGDRRRGVGTSFECVTRVGPLRTLDRMTVTEWRDGHTIGVRHSGIVTGEGRFTLHPPADPTDPADDHPETTVTWDETLTFPWYLAGPIGGTVAGPILRRIWEGNLRRLADRCRT